MAKSFNSEWDRVVRAIRDHYGMYDKVRDINIRKGLMALEGAVCLACGRWHETNE